MDVDVGFEVHPGSVALQLGDVPVMAITPRLSLLRRSACCRTSSPAKEFVGGS